MLNPTVLNSIVLPTSEAEANAAIAHLVSRKDAWVEVSLSDRRDYLQRCLVDVRAVAEAWVDAACAAKGLGPELAGEEWLSGPVATLSNLRLLLKTLKAKGQPQPIAVKSRSNGQLVAQVLPDTLMERLLWGRLPG